MVSPCLDHFQAGCDNSHLYLNISQRSLLRYSEHLALHDHHYHSSCIVTGLPASPKRNRANFSLQSGNTGPQVRKRCQQKAPKETTKCQAVTVNHTDTHTWYLLATANLSPSVPTGFRRGYCWQPWQSFFISICW